MSSSYKMNFHDLSRLMDDFFYLFQKGGRDKQILTGEKKGIAEKIIHYIVIFLKFVLIIVVLYTLYILIFRGYPRIMVNVLTLSFFHKEKLDDFIKERNLLINNFKFLANPPNKCISPYSIYESIYGGNNIQSNIQSFESLKDKYYGKYKYDDKYHNAFKEFFLFYNVYKDQTSEPVVYNNVKIDVKYYKFHELLVTYKIDIGEVDSKNAAGVEKSPDELIQEIYKKEQANPLRTLDAIANIHEVLINIGNQSKDIIEKYSNLPITSYIIIPPDDKTITNILNNFGKLKIQIQSGQVYSSPYSEMDDFSWCLLEYISYLSNPNQYGTFASQIPPYTNDDIYKLIYYLNLPRDQKKIADIRIMNSAANRNFFEFVNKRPIFSHIYFSQQNLGNKADFYSKVMNCYKLLCDCRLDNVTPDIEPATMRERLTNLKENGYAFKQFIISIAYLHLFLNVYQQNLTRMYNKQIISAKRFFMEMWQPVITDIMVNRIGNYFKLTFSSQGMGSSYKKFHTWYKQLGKDLNRMIKAVFKSFFTGVPVEKPQPTETS